MWRNVGAAGEKSDNKDTNLLTTRFFYKQHFYKQRQAEISKKSSDC